MTLPASLDEAVAALTAMPAAVPVAGGTDLMAAVNSGLLRPAGLVGLGRISETPRLALPGRPRRCSAPASPTRAWARPDFAALIPALAASARAAGPPQIRNAGTLGGNIATAAPTGDALPVLAALEADLMVAGPGGARREMPGLAPAGRPGDAAQPAELDRLRTGAAAARPAGLPQGDRADRARPRHRVRRRRARPGAARCALRGRRRRAHAAAAVGGRAAGSPRSSTGTARAGSRRRRSPPSASTSPLPASPTRRRRPTGERHCRRRPPYCTCGAPSPRWPDEHWGGRCRDHQ